LPKTTFMTKFDRGLG